MSDWQAIVGFETNLSLFYKKKLLFRFVVFMFVDLYQLVFSL